MNLAIIANSKLAFDGQHYLYKTGEWDYITRFAETGDPTVVCANVLSLDRLPPDVARQFSRVLNDSDLTVQPLPLPYAPRLSAWSRSGAQLRNMVALLKRTWHCEYAILLTPGWNSALTWSMMRLRRRPYAILVRGDWAGVMSNRLPQGRWLAGIRSFAGWLIASMQARMVEGASVRMSEGYALAESLPQIAHTFLPTLTLELKAGQFRKREDTCKDRPVRLISVGTLTARKGLDITIQAVHSLREAGVDIYLTVIGEGPNRPQITALVRELGLEDCVSLPGYLASLDGILDACYASDIFVLSSYSEGFPRVLYEAMSQSLPVVTTGVGAIPTVLEHEKQALIVPPGDSVALAEAIARVIGDETLRRELITQGFAFARAAVTHPHLDLAAAAIRASMAEQHHVEIDREKA